MYGLRFTHVIGGYDRRIERVMPDDRLTAPSWWQTLPGILTGLAAIITALTGLLLAFNRTNNHSEEVRPPVSSAAGVASRAAPAESRTSDGSNVANGAQRLTLPPLHRVRLANGDAVVTVLSAEIESIDLERRSLKLLVRHLNAGRYDANFWSSSYRLIVDGVPRAPTNLLDEVVAGNSAKEGEVIFQLPVSAKDVVLQISAGDETSRLPLKLP
jgi:hypothetical protein